MTPQAMTPQGATVLYRLSLLALLLAAVTYLAAVEREVFALVLLVREVARPVPASDAPSERPSA